MSIKSIVTPAFVLITTLVILSHVEGLPEITEAITGSQNNGVAQDPEGSKPEAGNTTNKILPIPEAKNSTSIIATDPEVQNTTKVTTREKGTQTSEPEIQNPGSEAPNTISDQIPPENDTATSESIVPQVLETVLDKITSETEPEAIDQYYDDAETDKTGNKTGGRFISGLWGSIKSGVGSVMSYFSPAEEEQDLQENAVIVQMLGVADGMKEIDPSEKKLLVTLLTNVTQLEIEKHSNDTTPPSSKDLVQTITKKAEEEGGSLLSDNAKKILASLASKAWKAGKKTVNLLAALSKHALIKGAEALTNKAGELIASMIQRESTDEEEDEPSLKVEMITPSSGIVTSTSETLTSTPTLPSAIITSTPTAVPSSTAVAATGPYEPNNSNPVTLISTTQMPLNSTTPVSTLNLATSSPSIVTTSDVLTPSVVPNATPIPNTSLPISNPNNNIPATPTPSNPPQTFQTAVAPPRYYYAPPPISKPAAPTANSTNPNTPKMYANPPPIPSPATTSPPQSAPTVSPPKFYYAPPPNMPNAPPPNTASVPSSNTVSVPPTSLPGVPNSNTPSVPSTNTPNLPSANTPSTPSANPPNVPPPIAPSALTSNTINTPPISTSNVPIPITPNTSNAPPPNPSPPPSNSNPPPIVSNVAVSPVISTTAPQPSPALSIPVSPPLVNQPATPGPTVLPPAPPSSSNLPPVSPSVVPSSTVVAPQPVQTSMATVSRPTIAVPAVAQAVVPSPIAVKSPNPYLFPPLPQNVASEYMAAMNMAQQNMASAGFPGKPQAQTPGLFGSPAFGYQNQPNLLSPLLGRPNFGMGRPTTGLTGILGLLG